MITSNISGFPRIGSRRELKKATEGYWAGSLSAEQLADAASAIRRDNLEFMVSEGIDMPPSGDFSFYDQVLDMASVMGVVPPRFGHPGGAVDLDGYFAMARGKDGIDALEMTKWFDTNYHYLVPEWAPDTAPKLSGYKPIEDFAEAKQIAANPVPVMVGPLTLLLLGKPAEGYEDFDPLLLLDDVLSVYEAILNRLAGAGAKWVQLDEPVLAQDRSPEELKALEKSLEHLGSLTTRPKLMVKTYFDHVGESFDVLKASPAEGLGLDFVWGPENEALIREGGGLEDKTLFAGVIDGRNVWAANLDHKLAQLTRLGASAGEVVVSTSCSLQFVPLDVDDEPQLEDEIRPWLAFAKQKVREVALLARGLADGTGAIEEELENNRRVLNARSTSSRAINKEVRSRVESLLTSSNGRGDYAKRRELQKSHLNLQVLPTTTIGSYPQTQEIRRARALLRKGDLTEEQYEGEMKAEIERVIRFQEEIGLDVLVHGEPERNDMVQYFAEQLEGFAFTQHGWVQSYGTRYWRPPIVIGDVHRSWPMTVDWTTYAQSLTDKPVKGIITGPVTILLWSFARDDLPPSETCRQIAAALRDELVDLEAAGFSILQVDEAAFREGLPMRREKWESYLAWAVDCFKLTASGASDKAQVNLHMCYSEFSEVMDSIDSLDADVLLIEASRSGMGLLEDFRRVGYSKEVGPGLYDIHSPMVPTVDEMTERLREAVKSIPADRIWVNPDCGLKTRTWEEVEPSLRNLVEAARRVRSEL